MTSTAPNINRFWADLIVEELVRCGVDYFCLAPGSRSTPLATAVADHARARSLVHFDERGAAFFALGYARATGRPAVCITTSGSAVANTAPAVVEADADSVPLLLLTADRPPELRQAGANQTIDQVKIFGSLVRWFVDMPVPDPAIDPAYVLTTIDQAVQRATAVRPGPVHLNCMFREPLAPDPDEGDRSALEARIDRWRRGSAPRTTYAAGLPAPADGQAEELRRLLEPTERGVIIAGRLPAWSDATSVATLAEYLAWPVLADMTSQLRGKDGSSVLIRFAHLILSDESACRRLRPEHILHVGGTVVSRRLLQFIEEADAACYVMAGDSPTRIDPAHRITHRFEGDPVALCRLMTRHPARRAGTYLEAWRAADAAACRTLEEMLDGTKPLTEPGIGRALWRISAGAAGLFLGSSMPIRDADMFAGFGLPVRVAANRGASGIDGTIATAAGFAAGLGGPVVAVLGDLAVLHDVNSLALTRNLDVPLCLVVVNNDGGGIFSFLPIARHASVFERFFGTPHGLDFEHAAAMFGLPYATAQTVEELEGFVRGALAREGGSLVEVKIDRRENAALHQSIEEAWRGRSW